MTIRTRLAAGGLAGAIALTAIFLILLQSASAQSGLPRRGVLPMVASDGIFAGDAVPPPDPSYCAPGQGGGSPETPTLGIFGTVRIGGVAAPPGTLVQLAFDGKVGPGKRVEVANGQAGYGLSSITGPNAACANRAGAAVSILVNGVPVSTGKLLGDDTLIGFRFDISLP
ncbi:MAG: hypothetical protein IT303_03560 [Dehalococcoidia bacterium]|nr:hypothetical protein [Dehalococcoidia bacterium]